MTAVTDSFIKTPSTAEFTSSNNYCETAFLPVDETFNGSHLKFNMDDGDLNDHDVGSWINSVDKYTLFRKHECYRDGGDGFVKRLDGAMELIYAILNEYPLEKIALSFNGGKDCTILLHLLRIAIDRKYGISRRIQAVYINSDDSFPEVDAFINETCTRYQIDLYKYPEPIKAGLQQLKEDRPEISVIFMGSRATDPHGVYMKSKRQWTDEGWPQYLRVLPILDWSYSDIWRALMGLQVQYCSLYDQGYTSLGSKKKTVKNDALKIIDEGGNIIGYRPAYELSIGSLERLGRKSSEA